MEGGPPSFTRSSTGSVLLWNIDNNGGSRFRIQDYHLLWSNFPVRSPDDHFVTPYQCPQPQRASSLVWAIPLSLAATDGVSIDFLSCRYLDVSVLCVDFTWPMHSARDNRVRLPCPIGLPHSEIPGLTVVRHLPRAYRSQPRPSSSLDT